MIIINAYNSINVLQDFDKSNFANEGILFFIK